MLFDWRFSDLTRSVQVDINRGVFTPSVSAKPGSNPKPAATSKTAVAKLAVAVKAGLKVSKTQGRTASAPSKRPLEDRLKAQLSNAFVCYEVPTPSRIISAPGKMKKNMCMVSAWPEFVYQSSAEDASWSGVPKASPATSTQQHDDTGEMLGSTVKTMHSNGDNSVEFLHGRPCGSSFGILDLTKASYPALFCLARNSGSEHALLGGILNSACPANDVHLRQTCTAVVCGTAAVSLPLRSDNFKVSHCCVAV